MYDTEERFEILLALMETLLNVVGGEKNLIAKPHPYLNNSNNSKNPNVTKLTMFSKSVDI